MKHYNIFWFSVSAFFVRPGLAAVAIAVALSAPAAAGPPRVVATVAPVHSLVATVTAGVSVPYLLLRGGASPHSYSMAPSDSRALAEAQLIVWVGEGLESFLRKPLAALAGRAAVVELSEVDGMTLLPRRDGGVWSEEAAHGGHGKEADRGHDHGNFDPHLWLDTGNAAKTLDAVAAALARLDPANAVRYRANAEAGRARLSALSQEIAETLLPVRARPFVVFHDAWQYFEREFGLAAAGAIAISPERSPGARRLAEIRARIRDAGVVCVFSEPQFPPALADTVVRGTAARRATLDPLGASRMPGAGLYEATMRALAADLLSCLRRDRR
jgi:zinc transport system substrate-binding protein